MKISFNLNSNLIADGILNSPLGRLKNYTLRFLKFINHKLQYEEIAIPAILVTNFTCVIVASKINEKIITYFIGQGLIGGKEDGKDTVVAYLGLNILSMSLFNLALYKNLNFNLSPLVYTSLSVTTATATLMTYIAVSTGSFN